MEEKSAGVIVFRGNPPVFLLLHYPQGHWDFPKGHIESGETEEQAALRELEEETGISDGNLIPGFREAITYFFQRGENTIHKTVAFFLAGTKTNAVRISHEHKGFKWLSFDSAMKQLTFENARKRLESANKFIAQMK